MSLTLWRCWTCEASRGSAHALCPRCMRDLGRQLFPRSSSQPQPEHMRALGWDHGTYARLIRLLKSQPWGWLPDDLRELLRSLVEHASAGWEALPPDTLVIPMPGQAWRSLRQSDLSYLFACELARALKITLGSNILSRPWWDFRMQKTRSRLERLEGPHVRCLRSAQGSWRHAPLLLVDDVCVTGSSFRQGELSLRRAGYQGSLATLALAQRPPPD